MNNIIDFLMTLLLPLLMAYSMIGEVFHEVVGTTMLILFITHLILHRKWWKAIPKGEYTAYRMFMTILNLMLLILMFLQPLSGIAMSHHLYTFLPLTGISALAREIHIALAYWSFVLMSLHLGLHVDMMLKRVTKKSKDTAAETKLEIASKIASVSAILIFAYGIYAFIKRGLPGYMFLQTKFAYFDFEEPIIFFMLDYIAIMILFAAVGYGIKKILRQKMN